MNADEYQRLAARTANDDNLQSVLVMCALGLTGEAGEVADYIKKYIYHGHDLQVSILEGEFGDVLWYLARACTILNISLSDVMIANIEKLKKRYPNGFTTEDSLARKDLK